MTNYSRIDLGESWSKIQQYVLQKVLPNEPVPFVSKVFDLKSAEFMSFMYHTLNGPLRSHGFNNCVPKGAILFGNEPGAVMGIHIDGYTADRKNSSNYALNIPILNCQQGYMNWYNGAYNLIEKRTKEGLAHLSIDWQEESTIAERAVIDTPTIVRVNIPHNVENLSDQPRIMLSIRFAPDLALLGQ